VISSFDRVRNAGLYAAAQSPTTRLHTASDGTMLAIDADGVARLSDPATAIAAAELARMVDSKLSIARGPVDALAAFVAALADSWLLTFEGHEMAWLAEAAAHDVAGDMQCSTALPESFDVFDAWREAFTREVFTTGGSPPPVPRDQLYIWRSATGQPCAMAGLVLQPAHAARVVTFYTVPAERGRGYACALVGAVARHARRDLLTLDVDVGDASARRTYERAGFRVVGRNAVWRRNVP
jgi:RimJ/RimL family protein N-acetyltransferase